MPTKRCTMRKKMAEIKSNAMLQIIRNPLVLLIRFASLQAMAQNHNNHWLMGSLETQEEAASRKIADNKTFNMLCALLLRMTQSCTLCIHLCIHLRSALQILQ